MQDTCIIDGCSRKNYMAGYCYSHWRGLPHEERIKARVVVDAETGCWVWQGPLSWSGYSKYYRDRKHTSGHRASYTLFVGPIPEGLTIDHLCRNRACVNPEHLEAVTMEENTLRGQGPSAENARKTHCRYGHPFDEENTHYFSYDSGISGRMCRACKRRDSLASYHRAQAKKRAARDLLENPGQT